MRRARRGVRLEEERSVTVARDHLGLEVLGSDECDRLLAESSIGRIAFVRAGSAELFPVNYAYSNKRVIFRSAVGSKLDAAAIRKSVTFEIDAWDTAAQSGWSVVLTGTLRVVPDAEQERVEALGLVTWVDTDQEMRAVEIIPDTITGRRL